VHFEINVLHILHQINAKY